jgi:hypothetical protein
VRRRKAAKAPAITAPKAHSDPLGAPTGAAEHDTFAVPVPVQSFPLHDDDPLASSFTVRTPFSAAMHCSTSFALM